MRNFSIVGTAAATEPVLSQAERKKASNPGFFSSSQNEGYFDYQHDCAES